MSSVTNGGDPRDRRRLTTGVKDGLRELTVQLSLLSRQVSSKVDLRDVDLGCLELINRYGPLTPTALARRAGLHPATMTGILDRLEKSGWIARDRDPGDRRAVLIRGLRERNAEIFQLFSGMNRAMDEICDGFDEQQLDTIADFLRKTVTAGHAATTALADE